MTRNCLLTSHCGYGAAASGERLSMFVQVECEEDVCNALQHWVLADPLERKALFGDLFGEPVC